jgi:3-oxoacyl-[acyl-carrier-protein] synthase III
MGAIINTFFLSVESSESSYLRSGASAVNKCLEHSPADMDGLGLLISTGVYRDRHIHEPAMASLIQGKLQKSFATKLKRTFSFDLHSGGGGVVMALSILTGFVESGKSEFGVVVAGDAEPYDGLAGALMVGNGESGEGFQGFFQDTYTEYSSEFRSYCHYSDNQLRLVTNQDQKYVAHCLECVGKSVDRFLFDSELCVDDIDLILPSQNPHGLAFAMADLYGQEKVVVLNREGTSYSAGVIMALTQAQGLGLYSNSRKVLFVNVGPGITVDLALYFNPR